LLPVSSVVKERGILPSPRETADGSGRALLESDKSLVLSRQILTKKKKSAKSWRYPGQGKDWKNPLTVEAGPRNEKEKRRSRCAGEEKNGNPRQKVLEKRGVVDTENNKERQRNRRKF